MRHRCIEKKNHVTNVVLLQVKECLELLEKARKYVPQNLWREHIPTKTSIFDF